MQLNSFPQLAHEIESGNTITTVLDGARRIGEVKQVYPDGDLQVVIFGDTPIRNRTMVLPALQCSRVEE